MGEKKKNKKFFLVCTAIFFICFIIMILVISRLNKDNKEIKKIKIGVTGYDKNDTFVSIIIKSMESEMTLYSNRRKEETPISINIVYAEKNQMKQNEQVQKFISLGYDIICVNLVDRTSASEIIDKAEEAGIPLIFFNREPVEEDIYRGENVYYVGTDAMETAKLQGKLVADKYHEDPYYLDRNQNGVIEYVMLEGESGHQDALIRTEYTIQAIKEKGISVEKLDSGTANWERSEAAAFMASWLDQYGDSIELVICNNDDMALGALDTLRGRNVTDVKVIGVDGTPGALEAIKYGHMLGTVSCEAKIQGSMIFKLAAELGKSGYPSQKLMKEGERYIRVDLNIIKTEEYQ